MEAKYRDRSGFTISQNDYDGLGPREKATFLYVPGTGPEYGMEPSRSSSVDQALPTVPVYSELLNPDGTLKSELQLKGQTSDLPELDKRLSGIQLNKEGLTEIRKRALSTGQSEWEKMMLGKQGVEEGAAMDKSAQEAAANASNALSQLAMKGGYSSGARERIADNSSRDTSLARQGVLRQGMLDRFTIGTKAEDQKLDLLRNLPGMEQEALKPEFAKVDAWRATSEAEKGRELDIAKQNQAAALKRNELQDLGKYKNYEEQMKLYAANKTGDAQANAGGK